MRTNKDEAEKQVKEVAKALQDSNATRKTEKIDISARIDALQKEIENLHEANKKLEADAEQAKRSALALSQRSLKKITSKEKKSMNESGSLESGDSPRKDKESPDSPGKKKKDKDFTKAQLATIEALIDKRLEKLERKRVSSMKARSPAPDKAIHDRKTPSISIADSNMRPAGTGQPTPRKEETPPPQQLQ